MEEPTPGTILQVKGIKPLDKKVRYFFKKGDIVYLTYKRKGKRNPIYEVRACEVIEKDSMLFRFI